MPSKKFARLSAVLALGLAAGCVSPSDPALDHWHYVYATIIEPRCTTSACHSPLSQAGLQPLDLSTDAIAYKKLAGRVCGDTTTAVGGYANTTSPTDSALVILLVQPDPGGMPPDRRLADQEITLVEDWMTRGALCD